MTLRGQHFIFGSTVFHSIECFWQYSNLYRCNWDVLAAHPKSVPHCLCSVKQTMTHVQTHVVLGRTGWHFHWTKCNNKVFDNSRMKIKKTTSHHQSILFHYLPAHNSPASSSSSLSTSTELLWERNSPQSIQFNNFFSKI